MGLICICEYKFTPVYLLSSSLQKGFRKEKKKKKTVN